ncbi:MAG: DivIVA domain-containing protein [Ilumatobacteraceae bacterium]
MAISFSRPDPSSPAAVGSASFPTNRRGFDQGEVRDFLRMVAAELARLQERERFLENELRTLQTRGMSAPGRLDEETVTTLLGEEAARVLSTARDASTQIRERAEESATRLVKDAAEDAARIRESANIEASRIREDAAHDAEAEIEMAKQQGRDMVNEARAYREKVLSELSRRRDAARGQIEQLLHGRDRLLNAFERARLASEDVINGLTEAHDEPEFIVDLSPTTGPIPVINPEHPSVKPFDHEVADEEIAVVEVAIEEPVIFDHETAVITEDVPEVPTVEEVVEVEVEVPPAVSEREEFTAPTDTTTHPVHDTVSDSTEQTNVVSLFGRGRRHEDVPEVPTVEEVVVAEPVVVEVDIAVEEVIQDQVVKPRTAIPGVDDIFAKLRAGSTADVAEKVSEAEPVVAEEITAAPEVLVPHVVEADPARFAERNEVLAPLVVAMARKLKRVLADEQNEVLQHLRLKRSSLEMDAFLGKVEEHAARYATAVVEETMSAAGAGAKSVKAAGGSSKRVTQKAVAAHVAASVADGLVAGFREEARIAIGEAEGDREILASLMRDVYRKWKMELIDQHVDDIAYSAYSKGGFLAMENTSRLSWMVDPDAPCCSECEDNSLAGAVAKGEAFPTGHQLPPAHPGCRCLVCPVQD